jgi:hypothetical protein
MHGNISLQQAKVWFSQMQTTPAALLKNVTVTEELVVLVIAFKLISEFLHVTTYVHIIIQKKFT